MKFMRAFNEKRNHQNVYLKMISLRFESYINEFTNEVYKEFDQKQIKLALIQK